MAVRWRRCEPIRCHRGRTLFSSSNAVVFSANRNHIRLIIRHNRAIWLFCHSPGNRYRSHLVHHRKRWSPVSGRLKTIPFLRSRFTSEFHCFDCSLVYGVYRCVLVSSTVTKRRTNFFGFRFTSVTNCCEVVSWARLLSGVNKLGSHRVESFLMQYTAHTVFWIQELSLELLVRILHGNHFRGTWEGLIKIDERTRWNLWNQVLTVAIKEE